MTIQEKEQHLEQIFDKVARTVDGQGRRIDLGIMGAVLYLNVHKIKTTFSCEGHLDHGLPYPWVWIPTEDHGKLTEMLTAFHEREEEGEEGEEGEEAMDRMLVIVSAFVEGVCVLQNFGAACQNVREPRLRAEKLKEYQREMQSFAEWLRDKFFGNEEIR